MKLIIYILSLLIFLNLGFIMHQLGLNDEKENKELNSDCIQYYYPDSEIETISKEVSDLKPYIEDVWDCSDMTNELVKRLRNRGYEAESISGYTIINDDFCYKDEDCGNKKRCIDYRCYGNHAWTRITIDIESTTGLRIFKEEMIKKEYIER